MFVGIRTVKRTIACLGRGGDATDPDSAPLPDRRRGAARRGGAPVVGDRAAAPGGEERAGAPAHGGRAEPAGVRAPFPPRGPPPGVPGPAPPPPPCARGGG